MVVLTALLLIAMAVLIPTLTRTLDQAYATLSDTKTMVRQAQESLDAVDALTEQAQRSLTGINAMIETMSGLVEDNTEALNSTIRKLNEIDFDKLNQSIEDLNQVVAPLAKLFGRG